MERSITVTFTTEDGWKHEQTFFAAETDIMEQRMKEAFRDFCRKVAEQKTDEGVIRWP